MRGGAAELARHLLSEECMGVELTDKDFDEIKQRVNARKEQIRRAEERKED